MGQIDKFTLAEAKEAASNDKYCKQLGTALYKALPSRRWYVEVTNKGRTCTVKIPEVSMEYGMVIHLEQSIEPDIKKVITSGGELLERFGLTRGRSDNHDLMRLARNSKGVIGAKKGEL